LDRVELERITKRYPGASELAVAGVDLAVSEGERFVIVGPSGSGKTTLLRIVAGLETPTSGDVRIGGRRMNDVAPRDRGVAMVFQHQALYPHLDVADNLAFGLKARHVARVERGQKVASIAGWLGLTGLLRRRPRALSGGERQRVALGRAVVQDPSVLMLDEPFSGLDAPLRASTRADLIATHRRVGSTMILVTHDQTEALATGERIAVMRGGRIEQVGTPRELYDRPVNRFVAGFLGEPSMSFLPCEIEYGRAQIKDGPILEGLAPLGTSSAWLGVRSEAVFVDRPGRTPHEVSATLDRVEPRGHEAIAWLRVGGHSLAARVDHRFDRRPGEPVAIGLDPDSIHWFRREGDESRIS
jgi:multiple sugar transport system ATP-binding protein